MSNRIVSITRFINIPLQKFEKFDVYKINENDIPFLQKIFTFLDKRKTNLDGMQEQLHKQCKRLLNDKYFFNNPSNKESIYLGIRDDNYITGIMTSERNFGCNHKMTGLFTSREKPIIKDSFIYAIEKDTPRGRAAHMDITGENFGFYKRDQIQNLKQKYPDWDFDTSKPKKEYNLEEVLGI